MGQFGEHPAPHVRSVALFSPDPCAGALSCAADLYVHLSSFIFLVKVPVDVLESDQEYLMVIDIPAGVSRSDVKVSIDAPNIQ